MSRQRHRRHLEGPSLSLEYVECLDMLIGVADRRFDNVGQSKILPSPGEVGQVDGPVQLVDTTGLQPSRSHHQWVDLWLLNLFLPVVVIFVVIFGLSICAPVIGFIIQLEIGPQQSITGDGTLEEPNMFQFRWLG